MHPRSLSKTAGISYIIIFFAAIFANFFVLEALIRAPLETVTQNPISVSFGIIAFLITVVFDVVVAWALYLLYKEHPYSLLSTLFRMMHAAIMGVAVFALPSVLKLLSKEEILNQVNSFNTIWLIGLFFFGIHLVLLSKIVEAPKFIKIFLWLAGVMYMVDTLAHFVLPNYQDYATLFLSLVAIPSIFGEMSLAVWLLLKGGKSNP